MMTTDALDSNPQIPMQPVNHSAVQPVNLTAQEFLARNDTEPMKILSEALELMRKKANDYQNPNSSVRQAMYYPHGIETLLDIIEAKKLRLISVVEATKAGNNPNFESIEDSLKDMINYCAIAAAWCRGKIDGQNLSNDIFNRPMQVG